MSSHSRLSPSSSARWLTCSASVQAIEDDIANGILPEPDPDDDGGPHAIWGTRCHLIGEMILLGNTEEEIIEAVPQAATDEEMVDTAVAYAEYVRGLMRPDSILFVEVRVSLSRWIPDAENSHGEMEEQGGTGDAIIIHSDGSMDVCDLKGGKGVFVEVKDNTQLMLYGAGAIEEYDMIYDIKKVRNHVIQPRRDSIAFQEFEADDLIAWMDDEVKPTADIIHYHPEQAEFVPSEKACQWCPRSGYCEHQHKALTTEVLSEFDDLDNMELADPQKLTIAQMVRIHKLQNEIKQFMKAVDERLLDRCKRGLRTTGIKMVEKNTNRTWADDDEAIAKALKALGASKSDIWKKKVVGITEAEKLVGKGKMNAHITKPVGQLTIAPTSDKRPAVKSIANDFDEVKDNE